VVKYTDDTGKVFHSHGGNKPLYPPPVGTRAIFIDEEESKKKKLEED
jgi:hypothetical protein